MVVYKDMMHINQAKATRQRSAQLAPAAHLTSMHSYPFPRMFHSICCHSLEGSIPLQGVDAYKQQVITDTPLLNVCAGISPLDDVIPPQRAPSRIR